MKFDSLLKSNHDLKKNGYKILRKLHKLENRANLSKAYGASCSKGCFVVLSCKELADIISDMYGSYDEQYIKSFLHHTAWFVNYLESVARIYSTLKSSILATYLTAYTKFFNQIIEGQRVKFSPNRVLYTKWNAGCIMAYTAVWGDR